MRSGSQLHSALSRQLGVGKHTSHTSQFQLQSNSITAFSESDDFSWPDEDTTLVTCVSGYLQIDLPDETTLVEVEPLTRAPTATRPAGKFIHGRSPLGLATPILAEDLKDSDAVARPRPVRIRSQPRAHKTEPPLARCLVKPDFDMKYYRRRVVDIALGNALARRDVRNNQASANVSA
ncbi:hypothetical protein AURDEDRAFT_169281 [Auricularia subglabra TFB-10046 SS5]|nr:hypothetical protein AURDEDRAFT_169281 [Auricularia subglabra TFB-10046 SS5]